MTGRLAGLPPLIDARARVLVLGSFPSAASLAARRYYAHPKNQFWRILEALLEQPLADSDYATQQVVVQAAGLAIWDVYASCERAGSLDSAIQNAQANDFRALTKHAPQLRRICFNGKTAARFAKPLAALGYDMVIAPSTSPAYTLAFDEKLDAWRAAIGGFLVRA